MQIKFRIGMQHNAIEADNRMVGENVRIAMIALPLSHSIQVNTYIIVCISSSSPATIDSEC